MNITTWSLVVASLIAIQGAVICLITIANKDIFDNRPASDYAQAVAELVRKRPVAGITIRICYGLSLIEVIGLVIAKWV